MRGALAAFASLFTLGLASDTIAADRPPAYARLSKGVTSELVRVDPATLRISGPRLPLWRHDQPWVRSPDGSRLAVGSGRARSIRIVDLRGWYVVRDLVLPRHLVALAWPRPDRLVAVVAGRCCPQPLHALALEPASGRTVASARVWRGNMLTAARTKEGLALVLARQRGIGAHRLATIDAAARVRVVRVDSVEAGWATDARPSRSGQPVSRYRTPGLAVDPAGRRALVAGSGALALVDLLTLAVRTAPIRMRTLSDGGLSSGTQRRALWLRGDRIAVTGSNDRLTGQTTRNSPAGLLLVDARTLAVRRLDSTTSAIARAGDVLLALGDAGATAYGLDGRRRYRTLRGMRLWELPSVGRYAYHGAADTYRRHLVVVLDLRDADASATYGCRAP